MVENLMMIAALCIVSSVICKLTGKYNKEQAVMLSAASCLLLLGYILMRMYPALNMVRELYEQCGISDEYLLILFKSLGVCYISRFACDICRDCGENALAGAAETAGRCAVLILAVPLFRDLSVIISEYAAG